MELMRLVIHDSEANRRSALSLLGRLFLRCQKMSCNAKVFHDMVCQEQDGEEETNSIQLVRVDRSKNGLTTVGEGNEHEHGSFKELDIDCNQAVISGAQFGNDDGEESEAPNGRLLGSAHDLLENLLPSPQENSSLQPPDAAGAGDANLSPSPMPDELVDQEIQSMMAGYVDSGVDITKESGNRSPSVEEMTDEVSALTRESIVTFQEVSDECKSSAKNLRDKGRLVMNVNLQSNSPTSMNQKSNAMDQQVNEEARADCMEICT